MAACDLTVIIDDANDGRAGGDPVSGTVVVKASKDVNCKALEVTCYWATHGRGNVARGEVETVTLFQGTWQADKEYSYPFKLRSASWPPTFYGNYLNVSHYVGARARVPWSTDPKTEAEFVISRADTPADLNPTVAQKKGTHWIGWLVGGIFIVAILGALAMLALFLLPIVLIGAAVFWFFKVYLPKQLTGPIELKVEPKLLKPGETLKGTCQFTPKRNLQINGITWTIKCIEKCVSGSGSNRSTHNHELLTKNVQLAGEGNLPVGQPQSFDFSFAIPSSAPPSLKFTDNELSWSSEFRIDIPKWPDWNKSIPFVVAAKPIKSLSSAQMSSPGALADTDDDPWLTEVFSQITQSQDDEDRLKTVLAAIESQVFNIHVDIQGGIEVPLFFEEQETENEHADHDTDDDSDLGTDGLWTAAVDTRRNVRLALLWPDDPEQYHWTDAWRGPATVLGYDDDTGRIMMRVTSNSQEKIGGS